MGTPAEAGLLRWKGAFSSGIFSSSRTLWGFHLCRRWNLWLLFCLLFASRPSPCCSSSLLWFLWYLSFIYSLLLPFLIMLLCLLAPLSPSCYSDSSFLCPLVFLSCFLYLLCAGRPVRYRTTSFNPLSHCLTPVYCEMDYVNVSS